ncbi:MAG TPA: ABC transporter permease, partial [Gemmatimonadaceae bacterium]|nr:ABC transporter permease [Gemmatimonadaceae bacterium]
MRRLSLIARPLWRRPAFALTSILSIGVGIGAAATVLGVVNALLLRPLPFANAERLVAIWPNQTVANRDVEALRTRANSFEAVAGVSPGWLMTLNGTRTPLQISTTKVSGNFFSMLGASPALGHTFGTEAETPGRDKLAVLSDALWRSAFDADPAVIGRSLQLSDGPLTVVGVMPADFHFSGNADLWMPLAMDRGAQSWDNAMSTAYGKIRIGTSEASASSRVAVLTAALRDEFKQPPNWMKGAAPVVGLQDSMVGGLRPTLLVLLAAVAFLLLIAIANVTNLFLVRTADRREELAVRSSLGATPGQIARLLLGESMMLGALGGILGVALACMGVRYLRYALPASTPRIGELNVDARVLAVAIAAAGLASVVAGLAPSLHGLRGDSGGTLRAGRTVLGGGTRARGALIAAEVALALVLTMGATLMGRTLMALNNADRGLRSDHLLTMKMQLPGVVSPDALRAYWHDVLAQVRAVPGVTATGTILHLPTSGRNWHADVEVDGRVPGVGESLPRAGWQSVSASYFSAAGMPVLKGRGFEDADGPNAPPVVVLNTALADKLFPGENPVGHRIRAGFATSKDWATVVGVVSSVRHDSLNAPPAPELYVPFDQKAVGANSLVVRTTAEPTALAAALRDRIWSVNRDVPITDVRTMDDLFSQSLQRQRIVLYLFGFFAATGLLLSAVGIYGVVAYGVRQQLREIGIRVALGADAARIRRLVVGHGVRFALFGIAVGTPTALALSGYMRGMVYGVTTTDPFLFLTV